MTDFNGKVVHYSQDGSTIFIPLPREQWRPAGHCLCPHCKGKEAFWDTIAVAIPRRDDKATRSHAWTVHFPGIQPEPAAPPPPTDTGPYESFGLEYDEGWGVFETDRDGALYYDIQRLDSPQDARPTHPRDPLFADDEAALTFVRERALADSQYHREALAIHGIVIPYVGTARAYNRFRDMGSDDPALTLVRERLSPTIES